MPSTLLERRAISHAEWRRLAPLLVVHKPRKKPGRPRRAAPAWFNRFRGLLIRWAKKAQNYLALVQLAAVLIIYRKLRHARLLSG